MSSPAFPSITISQGRNIYANQALKLNNAKAVRDAKTWYSKRRPEIEEMFVPSSMAERRAARRTRALRSSMRALRRSTAKRFASRSRSISPKRRPARRSIC